MRADKGALRYGELAEEEDLERRGVSPLEAASQESLQTNDISNIEIPNPDHGRRSLQTDENISPSFLAKTVRKNELGPELTSNRARVLQNRDKSSFGDSGLAADKTAASVDDVNSQSTLLHQSNNSTPTVKLFCQLSMKLLRVAIPAVTSQLVIILVEAISMIFIGQLNDTDAIAGVGLAIIYVNATTTSVLMGLNGAVSVLGAVAFGKGDLRECKRVLQRGRILCFLMSIPLFGLQVSCYPILLKLGVKEEVAWYTSQYGFFLFLAMTFHCQFDCYRNFFNSIGLSRVLQYGLTVSILLHVMLCYQLT